MFVSLSCPRLLLTGLPCVDLNEIGGIGESEIEEQKKQHGIRSCEYRFCVPILRLAEHILPVKLQVKGSNDEKTLCVRFFHFFYKFGVAEEFAEFPRVEDCTTEGWKITYAGLKKCGFGSFIQVVVESLAQGPL